MYRCLLLVCDSKSQFFYCVSNQKSLLISDIYVNLNILERIIRKIMVLLGLNIKYFYGEWKSTNFCPDKIIIEDGTFDDGIVPYIKKMFPNALLVYWFRNSLNAVDYVKSQSKHLKHARMCDKIVSFDRIDSKKYGFEYMPNCYCRDFSLKASGTLYDMIFMGAEKSRYDLVMKVVDHTEDMKWNNYIYIYSKTRPESQYVHNSLISYRQYLEAMVASKAILDIVDTTYQNGYSLRIYESLFYKKKLITNSLIISKESFYNENNIFILNTENEESYVELMKFMNKPYVDVDTSIISQYEINNWVQNI